MDLFAENLNQGEMKYINEDWWLWGLRESGRVTDCDRGLDLESDILHLRRKKMYQHVLIEMGTQNQAV